MENKPEISSREEATVGRLLLGAQAQVLVGDVLHLLRQGVGGSGLTFFNLLHPVDQGEVLVELARQPRQELLTALSPDETAEILENMGVEEAVEVSERIEASTLSQILDETSPDVAADILRHLSEDKSRETLDTMEEAEEVIPLLQYADDSAGGLMTTDYPVVRGAINASIALDQLRLLGADSERVSSVFVVDDEHRLVGSLSVTRLALARLTTVVRDISVPEAIMVYPETDQEECARLMERYDLAHLPVVDRDGFLKGVILAEDMVDVVEEEATEDMYHLAGLSEEDRVFTSPVHSVRKRLPWMFVNLATVFVAAGVVGLFQQTIENLVALAMLLPVVAGMGGNGGIQTLTVITRAIALEEIEFSSGIRAVGKELLVGLMIGAITGLASAGIVTLWQGNPVLGLVIFIAMVGTMAVAGLLGASVPLALKALGQDPALGAGVVVTFFTDAFGFASFLGIATLLMDHLL